MSIVLLGSQGMLGHAFSRLFRAAGVQVAEPDRGSVDLGRLAKGDTERLENHLRTAPMVISCAAFTDVDDAETREEEATRINGEGVGALAALCDAASVPLVHFGTDYVFSGESTTPYRPDTPRMPLNAYGRSKAAGEVALEQSNAEFLHLRTSWLYAPWGTNFVRTMARLTKERDTLEVVDDQRGRPTSAEHLARTTLALFRKGLRGIHHATDGGECSWFELACFVRDHLGHQCDISPCSSHAFPRPAPRPRYSVLDLSETEAAVGPMVDWKTSVASVLDRAIDQHVVSL